MVVYKIVKCYHQNSVSYDVIPYDLKGSFMAGMPKKKWWYRSEKKANKICEKRNKQI